jgi:hypothetical protein
MTDDFEHLAVFDYEDAAGNLLYQNVLSPLVASVSNDKPDRQFYLRRPNGKGGWSGDLGDVAQVPYRLPNLSEALMHGATVFIPKGETKADHIWAWSIPATTSRRAPRSRTLPTCSATPTSF